MARLTDDKEDLFAVFETRLLNKNLVRVKMDSWTKLVLLFSCNFTRKSTFINLEFKNGDI